MKDVKHSGNVAFIMPDKKVQSLTDNELKLGYEAARALMQNGIPAQVYFDGTGVVYDGQDNLIERRLAIVWLTVKGEAVIMTSLSGTEEFSVEKIQILVNGIVEQFKQAIAAAEKATN